MLSARARGRPVPEHGGRLALTAQLGRGLVQPDWSAVGVDEPLA
jgi:hypothetical protein